MKINQENVDYLKNFEEEVSKRFINKEIKAPVHLYANNEEEVLAISEYLNIGENTDVFCTWRSHYCALVKNIPREEIMNEILKGHSISLCFPKYNFYSSGIVGAHLSWAVGKAYSNKLLKNGRKVVCVLGDMASLSGNFQEAMQYSVWNNLDIIFVIEDNGKSVCTDTEMCWKVKPEGYNINNITGLFTSGRQSKTIFSRYQIEENRFDRFNEKEEYVSFNNEEQNGTRYGKLDKCVRYFQDLKTIYYKYKLGINHAGPLSGERVQF